MKTDIRLEAAARAFHIREDPNPDSYTVLDRQILIKTFRNCLKPQMIENTIF